MSERSEVAELAAAGGLLDALNAALLAVPGVTELFPPRGVAQSAADQLIAVLRQDQPPTLRTVLVEEYDGGVKVTARIGVATEAKTPEVVTAVAGRIKAFISAEVNDELRCVASVQAVSIQ